MLGHIVRCVVVAFTIILVSIKVCMFGFPGGFSFNNISNVTIIFSRFVPVASTRVGLIVGLVLLIVKFVILNQSFKIGATCIAIISSLLLGIFRGIFPVSETLAKGVVLRLYFTVVLPTLTTTLLFFRGTSNNNASVITVVVGGCSAVGVSNTLFTISYIVIIISFVIFSLAAKLYSMLKLVTGALLVSGSVREVGLGGCFAVVSDGPSRVYRFVVGKLSQDTAICRKRNICSRGSGGVVLAIISIERTILLREFVSRISPRTFLVIAGDDRIIKGKFVDCV